MTGTPTATTSVFLCFDPGARVATQGVAKRLLAAGATIANSDLSPARAYDDPMRKAIRGCDVVLVVLAGEELHSSVLFEIGAAQGAQKPLFICPAGGSRVKLPFRFNASHLIPLQRVEDVLAVFASESAA